MGQSNYIAAAIAVAFFVYITAKGSLKNYVSLMTGDGGFSSDKTNAETSAAASEADANDPKTAATAGDQVPDWLNKPVWGLFDASKVLDGVEMFGGM